jgi:hypothetical protein
MLEPKVVLLKQGTCLIGDLEEESRDNTVLWIIRPVEVERVPVVRGDQVGETFTFKPWLALSSDERFILSKKDILTFCNPEEKIRRHYNDFIDDYYNNFEKSAKQEDKNSEEELFNKLNVTDTIH